MSNEEKVIYLADVRERNGAPGTPCPLFPSEAIEVCGDADPNGHQAADATGLYEECENAPLCRAAMVAKSARSDGGGTTDGT